MTNSVMLMGRLCCLPEKTAESEYCISIRLEDSDETFEIVIWPQMARIIKKQYPIGTLTAIRGCLKNTDGKMWITATRISFISSSEL